MIEVASTPQCNGAAISVSATEGLAYTWDAAEFTGNAVMTTQQLTSLAAVKEGAVADGTKTREMVDTLRTAYAHVGYVDAALPITTTFDDGRQRAKYHVTVNEGPQYHMGTVTVLGVPDKNAADVVKSWKLRTGDVYDASYLAMFLRDPAVSSTLHSGPARQVEINQRKNTAALIVDVIFTVK
jgi:outer membrane protein insertion porin family